MGASLNPNHIKEGDDVYFECSVRANPKHYKLVWYKEVSEMVLNIISINMFMKILTESPTISTDD